MNDFEDERELAEEETPPEKSFVRTQLLTIIRLILCVLVILSAYVVKTIGGELYAAVGTWFFDNYNNSIMTGMADAPLSFIDPITVTETSISSDSSVPPAPQASEESTS